ncbi:MAG: nitroreductase [Hyphomonadaceae bacterium]|nr:nitroreductase [Hyphomonadaceae bacterium]
MDVDTALKTRISTRAFKPDPLPEALVRDILDVARWAPSGGNVQPWKVIAVAGAARDAVIDLARSAAQTNPAGEVGDHPIYPEELWEPHRSWRYKVGEDMYALLGIPREDKMARFAHLARNMVFFDAPVGLFFVIDKRMGHGQWAHLGMFMQSVALAAQARGVASCMQEFWARARETLKAHFALPDTEMIYCGMALGYADPDAPVNSLRSDRASVDQFARFSGF